MDFSDFNITVVGLGLIGGSLAMAINKRIKPKHLWGIDIDIEALQQAKTLGIINEGFTDSALPLQESDLVFICLYPKATMDFLKKNMFNFKSGAIVTDVVGLKESLIQEISSFLREDIDFIGGHPMAGNEFKGFKFASDKIFEGADYIITPLPKNNRNNISVLKEFILEMGFANLVEMTPEEHDYMVAFTSHLPHIIALALVSNPIIEKNNICTGNSFRDATRVAKINGDLWAELLLGNGHNLARHLEIFQSNLEKIKKAILNGDAAYLRELFTRACRYKEILDDKGSPVV